MGWINMDILCMKFCELVVAVESYESYENADCTEDSEPFLTFLVGEILKSSNLVSNCESGMTNSSLPSLFLSSPPSLPSLLIPVGLEQKLTIMVESKDSSLSFPQSDGGYLEGNMKIVMHISIATSFCLNPHHHTCKRRPE